MTEPVSPLEQIRRTLVDAQKSPKEVKELDPVQQAEVDDRTTDTRLKRLYAYWFIGILIGQLFVMNLVFILAGVDVLKYEHPTYLNLYMGGTLAEVFGVVLVITRYLFSRRNA